MATYPPPPAPTPPAPASLGDYAIAGAGFVVGVAGLGISFYPYIPTTRIEAFYRPTKAARNPALGADESRVSWSAIKKYFFTDVGVPLVRVAVLRIVSERLYAFADLGLAALLSPVLPYGRLNVAVGPTSLLLTYAPGAFAISAVATFALDALFLPFKVALTRAALLKSSRPSKDLLSHTERSQPLTIYKRLLPALLGTSVFTTSSSLLTSFLISLTDPESALALPARLLAVASNLFSSVVMTRLIAQYTVEGEQIDSVVPVRPQPYKGWLDCVKSIVREEGYWFAGWVLVNSALGLGMLEVLTRGQQAGEGLPAPADV